MEFKMKENRSFRHEGTKVFVILFIEYNIIHSTSRSEGVGMTASISKCQSYFLRHRDVTGGLPCELDGVLVVGVGTLDLSVGTLHNVSVHVMPAALSLRLIIVEVSFEIGAVVVQPLAIDHLTVLEGANVLHARLLEDVGTCSVLLPLFPLTRVDVLVLVDHDALAMAFTVFPVPVILAYACVDLNTNSIFIVV